MTTRRITLYCLATLLSSLSFTSCLDEDTQVSFDPTVKGYIFQDYADNGANAEEEYTFTPCFSVLSNDNSFVLEKVSMSSVDIIIPFTKHSDYVWTSNCTQKFASLSEMKGTYNIVSTCTNGFSNSSFITINIADTMAIGNIQVENFTYNGNYIKARLKDVKNAEVIGFVLTPYNDETPIDWKYNSFTPMASYPFTYNSNGDIELSAQFNRSNLASDEKIRVAIYASNSEGVYHFSKIQRTITFNGETFVEEN